MLTAEIEGVEHEGIASALNADMKAMVTTDGKVTVDDGTVTINNAQSAVIRIAAATNYVNYHDISGKPKDKTNQTLSGVTGKSFDNLLKAHLKKYQEQYNRVVLNLPKSKNSGLETDQRVAAFEKDASD